MARRSATEVAAILDILDRRAAVPSEMLDQAREILIRIVSMLVKLATK